MQHALRERFRRQCRAVADPAGPGRPAPTDYGKFSFALALATIFETCMDFGLKEITTRSIARERGTAHRLVANIFGLKLLLAGGTMLA